MLADFQKKRELCFRYPNGDRAANDLDLTTIELTDDS
jgi:hypothetical protein